MNQLNYYFIANVHPLDQRMGYLPQQVQEHNLYHQGQDSSINVPAASIATHVNPAGCYQAGRQHP